MNQLKGSAVRRFLVESRWGASSMVALYLSLISGVVVSLQYDSAHPYFSASSLDILAPFGAFWRSLHFFSSQAFFVLAVVHLIAIVVEGSCSLMVSKRWLPLSLSMVVALLLLFTGYILRGDATGSSAGMIAENILLSLPLVGGFLDSLLFSMIDEGMKRVYANHLIGLGLLWLVLAWDHIRRYRVTWRQQPVLVLSLVALAAFVSAPMEPERLGVFHINGPWFFVGLQELLRYAPPFWAGIVWPATLLAAIALLQKEDASVALRARWYCLAWLTVYGFLTAVGFSR